MTFSPFHQMRAFFCPVTMVHRRTLDICIFIRSYTKKPVPKNRLWCFVSCNLVVAVPGASRCVVGWSYHDTRLFQPNTVTTSAHAHSWIHRNTKKKLLSAAIVLQVFILHMHTHILLYLVCIRVYYNLRPGGKMKSTDLIKELTAAGCELKRHNGGSHQIWWSPVTGKTFPVPHPKKDLPPGTVRSIKKLAGI